MKVLCIALFTAAAGLATACIDEGIDDSSDTGEEDINEAGVPKFTWHTRQSPPSMYYAADAQGRCISRWAWSDTWVLEGLCVGYRQWGTACRRGLEGWTAYDNPAERLVCQKNW